MSRSFSIPSSSRADRSHNLTVRPPSHAITRPLRSVRSALHRLRASRSASTPLCLGRPETIIRSEASQQVKSFVNTLSDAKLSNFLLWYLHHDIVDPPESISLLFAPFPDTEMRGWIALGQFLSTGTPYGLDLVVFTSCCDRMNLDKNAVQEVLGRLSNPAKVAWTTLAATIQEAQQAHMTEAEMLQLVRQKLTSLRSLTLSVKPVDGSKAAEVQAKVANRIKDFIDYVVDPRLDELGVIYSTLLHQTDILERRQEMTYYFEVMQRPREVSPSFYELNPHAMEEISPTSTWQTIRSSSIIEPIAGAGDFETKEAANVTALQNEVGQLRSRVADLEHEVDQLRKEKEALLQQLSQPASSPPEPELHSLSLVSTESLILPDTPTPTPHALGGKRHRYSPPAAIRHHRAPTLLFVDQSPQNEPASGSSPPVAPSSDYDEIFQPLDHTARFSLGFTSPVTDATSPATGEDYHPLPRDVASMDLRADLGRRASPSLCGSTSRAGNTREKEDQTSPQYRLATNSIAAVSQGDGASERSPSRGRSLRSSLRRKGSIGNALNSLFRRRVSDKQD